ncbi:MAG: amino acid adenylation domain-containing protein, partial [Ferruginibacter sp.]
AQLQQLGRQHGATMFMTLVAAFKVLMHRYSGQEDICVGTPIANRTSREVEDLIGFFVNTLALRSDVNSELSFKELLQQVKTTTLEAYEHQDVPFEKVVDVVLKERDMSRNPLFQVMFILQNTPDVPELKLGDVQLSSEGFKHSSSKFDLTFALVENEAGINGSVEYCTDLFDETTIIRMTGHFEELLKAIVKAPQQTVELLGMLKPEETQLLTTFNETKVVYPTATTIAHLFEEQVIKTPDQIAVVFEKDKLTYQQLNERSNQLAHYLRSKGIQEETLVPICVERSIEMIVGVLAILKAGAVYVPIDPEYPAARISYMLQDMGAALVISSSKSKEKLGTHDKVEVVEIDSDWNRIASQPTKNINTTTTPNRLAYILYTSGSTGIPKGVKMPESNLVNLLRWQEKQFENYDRKVLQFASLNFDVSFQEIFSTLCFGSALHLVSEDRRKDMAEIVKDIDEQGLTHLFVPYIVLKSLAEYVAPLDRNALYLEEIIVAGEQLKLTEDIGIFLEKNNIKLINQYGPTEAHVVSSYNVTDNYLTTPLPPIGKPIDNVQLYILNPGKDLCAVSIPGELYIAGAQVAQGYLDRPELTAEKFIPNIFDTEGESLMYKTGDLARWLPDGNIEYLGRIDEQVKIRGYRIELGEIESVLQQSELVKQAVVLAKEDNSGSKRLVAYVVPEAAFDKESMITHLRSRLPEYMVPALWVELESLPLSPNGKIDRKALPNPDLNLASGRGYVAPRNEMEQKLANIWQELLGVEKVGVHDNFFHLGGHSLLAMKMVAHMKKTLLISIPIQVLFQFTTINDLSNYLDWEHDLPEEADSETFEVIKI